jgi:NAD(P)H-flavin reductase
MATFPAAEPAALPAAMVPVPHRVARRRRETHDTWTLELEPAEHGALAPFAAGQFAMLYAFGAGEAPISVSALGDGDGRLVHTIRAVGTVTSALCRARAGDVVGVRGPFGTSWPLVEAEGRDVVILAGGIGLAPLRPVVRAVMSRRERYGGVAVLYGGRSPRELLYGPELERWRGRFDVDIDVRVTVDSAGAGWRGRVGVVTDLLRRARFAPEEAVAMLCGPEVMMRFAVPALLERGVEKERIWLSTERSMKCAVGHCGHCQLGPVFVCKDGPVLRYDRVEPFIWVRRL